MEWVDFSCNARMDKSFARSSCPAPLKKLARAAIFQRVRWRKACDWLPHITGCELKHRELKKLLRGVYFTV